MGTVSKWICRGLLYGSIFSIGYIKGCSSCERRNQSEEYMKIERSFFESLGPDQKWELVKYGVKRGAKSFLEEVDEVRDDAMNKFRETKLYEKFNK